MVHALQNETLSPAAPVEDSAVGIVDVATAIRLGACKIPINGEMTRCGAN
jgi:hypothetical protein